MRFVEGREERRLEKRRAVVRRRRLIAGLIVLGLVAIVAYPAIRDRIEGDADPQGAVVASFEIDSEATDGERGVTVVTPSAVRERNGSKPLLVFLHGRNGDEDTFLGYGPLFEALAKLGPSAPVVAFPDGGGDSYWHDRADGDWDAYVVDEVIPEVARRNDIDPRRVAIGGISMGGFGAFGIAQKHPGRFCAVGGHSAALWSSGGETAPGAFDDAEDFERNDVIETAQDDPGAFLSQPVWLDTGDEDPFVPGIEAFASALRDSGARLTFRRAPGGHDTSYWNAHWPEYFAFYAKALRDCRG